MKNINEYVYNGERISSIDEYLISKTKKLNVPNYCNLIDMLNSLSSKKHFIKRLETALEKIGNCELFDLMTKGIMNAIETNKYELVLGDLDSINDFTRNYIMIDVGKNIPYISFDIYTPDNSKANVIHVETKYTNFNIFHVYIVSGMKADDFIEKYVEGDCGEYGEEWDIDKDKPNPSFLKELEYYINKI